MNLTHLRYVIEVERQGSITKAAAALYMGQPNLSKVIKEMEQEIGIPIFRRSAKGVVPTEKGREFLHYAKAILVQIEKMEELYKDSEGKRSDIRILLPYAGYAGRAAAEFAGSQSDCGQMSLRLAEADTREAVDAVTECEYDLAVIRFDADEEEKIAALLAEKDIRSQEIRIYDEVLTVSSGSPLAALDEISPTELSGCIEIVRGGARHISEIMRGTAAGAASPKKRIGMSGGALEALGSIPDGYMYTEPMCREVLDRYGLVQVKCTEKRTMREVLIYQSSYRQNENEKRFISILKQIAEDIGEGR